jgi:hypothetical protein
VAPAQLVVDPSPPGLGPAGMVSCDVPDMRSAVRAVVVAVVLDALSGRATAHPAACFPERTIVAPAALYDSNGAPVGSVLTGQVVHVTDEVDSEELWEVEVPAFGGVRVRVEWTRLAGFARADIPIYSSPKGQGWWGQNAPLRVMGGDAKSALVDPHPNARTPEMEGIAFGGQTLSCAGLSGEPVTPLKITGCRECAAEPVPVPERGPAVWWWWAPPDETVYPGVAANRSFYASSKSGRPLMRGHLAEATNLSARSQRDGGAQDGYAVVETVWGPLRRRDPIMRSRLLFEEPKDVHGIGRGSLCGLRGGFNNPDLADADTALVASAAPFRFFEKGKDVFTLPAGTKVHAAPSSGERVLIGLNWPSDDHPMLTLTGWIPSRQLTDRKRPPFDEKKGADFGPPARRHHRKKAN